MLRIVLLLLLVILYAPIALGVLVDCWNDDNYSYGVLVPLLVGALAWKRRHDPVSLSARATRLWTCLAWCSLAAGLALYIVGHAAAEQFTVRVSGVAVALGLTGIWGGAASLRRYVLPIVLLVAMVPLPYTIYYRMSFPLQLLSARIAAGCLDGIGLEVQRWGNIFEVNGHSMEVVRACSGVRSMMTLGTMAAALAVVLRMRLWAGVSLLLLSAPIAMLGNTVRLVGTSLLVVGFGPGMSEGWRHDMVGVIGFAASLLFLSLATRLLLGGRGIADAWQATRSAQPSGSIPASAGSADGAAGAAAPRFDWQVALRYMWHGLVPQAQRAAIGALVVVAAGGSYGLFLGSHTAEPGESSNLAGFPMRILDLHGTEVGLSDRVREEVGVDDYLFRNYESASGEHVNLYIGYYRSQRQGSQIHSPQHCYPGSGWDVERSEPLRVRNRKGDVEELRRLVVSKKDRTDVVVYWYDTRTGRLSNDFHLKFNLMRTALLHMPQDAAFVRWSTPVAEEEDIDAATLRLLTVAARSLPQLDRSLPFGG